MEIIINETCIKYEDNKIWKFGKYKRSKQNTWHILVGSIHIDQNNYKSHKTKINGKEYTTSRLIYKLHNPEWNINDSSQDNSIDHINRNSLDNRIENLRVATMLEQALNKDCIINAKGYYFENGKWGAKINIDGVRKSLGYFEKEEDARNAYLNAVQERKSLKIISGIKIRKGYTWNKINKKWMAKIKIDGKQKYLGSFEKEEDARNAYINAVNERIKI